MRTINYELQGNDVPESLRGKTIRLQVPETYREAESLTKAGESDVVAKFADGDVIRRQGRLRGKSKKALKDANGDAEKAIGALQAWNDGADSVYTVRAEGDGTPSAPKTAKGRQTKAAASSGNRLFERCLADETFLSRMVKQNVVDQAEYDEWKAARAEAVAAEKTPAATA
jgi:hypothetical protein